MPLVRFAGPETRELTFLSFPRFGDDVDEGYRYGQLSISIFEKFKGSTWLVRLSTGYYGCVHPWKKPVQEILLPLKRAHQTGLESGDIEFAMLSANVYVWTQVSDRISLFERSHRFDFSTERCRLISFLYQISTARS